MSSEANGSTKQLAGSTRLPHSISQADGLILPSLSLVYDPEKDKYSTVDNSTGKFTRVTSLGQTPLEYDLKISGVAPTKLRNVLAKQKPGLQYMIPDSLRFQPEASYYAKPQRKFVGYVQFPRPNIHLNVSDASQSVGEVIQHSQNNFLGKPALRPKNIGHVEQNGSESKMNRFARRQFGGTRSETALSAANEDPFMLTNRTTHGGGKMAQQDIAKAIQDQFNKTYSKRLQKVPSFLSTHMSSFASQYHLGEVDLS